MGVVENGHAGFLAHVLSHANPANPEAPEMRIRRSTLVEALGNDHDVNAAVLALRQHGVPARVAATYGTAFTSISRIAEVTASGANAVAVFDTDAGRFITIPDNSTATDQDNPWLTVCAGVPPRLERALASLWAPPSAGLSHHIASNVSLSR
ncbi:hypothetical protein GCM10011410_16480 [Hoyosella rhizosphaerae]|uniref:Uncharacterized protein n=1 Tax=Hoyosella rhizosphaerae TaxID=1755582 RepID=A0A916XCW7_9ACTN|nr:hypothetical protein GCM10011410_16480 [Hoyosella rhizosphaerae]